jgi:hypothetical protein
LPEAFLRELGLVDFRYRGTPAVRIPYFLEDGSDGPVRFRLRLEKGPEGDERFKWKTGSKAIPYGLWRLDRARAHGYIVLVEGESDAQTLWFHDYPALGVPGANTWRDDWTVFLDGFPVVYAVVEPDRGGKALRARLAASPLCDRLHFFSLTPHKDVSELHLS